MYSKVNSHSRMLYGLMKNRKFSYCSTSRGLEGSIGKKKKKKDWAVIFLIQPIIKISIDFV